MPSEQSWCNAKRVLMGNCVWMAAVLKAEVAESAAKCLSLGGGSLSSGGSRSRVRF